MMIVRNLQEVKITFSIGGCHWFNRRLCSEKGAVRRNPKHEGLLAGSTDGDKSLIGVLLTL